jgi:hypothetical protein
MHGVARRLPVLPALPVLAVGLAGAMVLGLAGGDDARRGAPAQAAAAPGLGPGSVAQVRGLREASARLAAELRRSARCDPRVPRAAYHRCVLPGLRHAGIGGSSTALLAGTVARDLPAGACRASLGSLAGASSETGGIARDLLAHLYYRDGGTQAQMAVALAGLARMLTGAVHRTDPTACALAARGPAL